MRHFGFVLALAAASPVCGADSAIGPTPAPIAAPLDIEVEHGERRPVLDGVGWVIGVPSKLVMLDRRVDNHEVSPVTVEETYDYLREHEVDGVLVRVNQYDPWGEWRRLAENDRVGLGWRATVGTLYTLGYSVLPGRVFGGDWYNPFTDTVHLYSDVPALALEQAAQARELRTRSHPGLFSATRLLPLVGLVHEARAKEEVFEHVDQTGDPEAQAEARRVLHPQLGREIGGHAALFVPQGDALLSLGGAAVGHVVGRYQASRIETDGAGDAAPASHTKEAAAVPCAGEVTPRARD